tara:strand:+ start:225 stop:428 length:204 start_codon:yes stop_codon:yes gene_type:complete
MDTEKNNIKSCDPPCERRPMLGRSWWKKLGYNYPCGCAELRAEAKEPPYTEQGSYHLIGGVWTLLKN